MNEELKQKLIKEIKKSGFPLELDVINKLRELEFLVYPNLSFTDDTDKPHEIDAFVIMGNEDRKGEWPFGPTSLFLFIECKSSDKPWVFFNDTTDYMTLMGLVDRLKLVTDIDVSQIHSLLVGANNTTLRGHHYCSDIPVARTYLEAFGRDAGGDIYQAVKNIWYVIDFHKRFFGSNPKRKNENKRTGIIHGVIVYEGTLVAATKEGEDFELAEVPHIMLRTTDCITNKSLPFGSGRETVIDVIHKDYLEQYLLLCKHDLTLFVDHSIRVVNTGWLDEQLKQSEGNDYTDQTKAYDSVKTVP